MCLLNSRQKYNEYSGQVEKNSAYLLGLIDNIIDIADMDSQTADMPKEVEGHRPQRVGHRPDGPQRPRRARAPARTYPYKKDFMCQK